MYEARKPKCASVILRMTSGSLYLISCIHGCRQEASCTGFSVCRIHSSACGLQEQQGASPFVLTRVAKLTGLTARTGRSAARAVAEAALPREVWLGQTLCLTEL